MTWASRSVKNIARPIGVHRVSLAETAPLAAAQSRRSLNRKFQPAVDRRVAIR